ncbi:shieldin complex subunit 2 isoform X2 [Acomys russatus]|uniref:shieldin complex subunit 2 isoform X2 n=1 Tax=Acomys russatus TaxID=60746 RepID=UPI0021E25726|nr:shieldin complex subunit 2 isoform X2 [Acomys russatus]
MSRRSQVHIFWGAPVAPLKMTISQGTTSLMSTANTWEKVQLFYKQHSSYLKAENQELKNLEDCPVPEALGPPDPLSGHLLATYVSSPAQVEGGFAHSAFESQRVRFQEINVRDVASVQTCGDKDRVQPLPGEENDPKHQCENEDIADEQCKDESHPGVENCQADVSRLDPKCAAGLDVDCSAEHTNIGPEAMRTEPVPTARHETQSQEIFSSDTHCEPESEGAVRKASDQKVSTDTEFLSIMTSSQCAFLAQGSSKGQDCINKKTVNVETEATGRQGVRPSKGDVMKPSEDFAQGPEDEQSQAHSLELFSPVCPESESTHIHISPGKSLEENISSQELFSNEENLPPNEEHNIEWCSSGVLRSQRGAFHQSAAKRSWSPEGSSHHSKALSEVRQVSKKPRTDSDTGESAKTVPLRIMSKFKDIKHISLIKNCDSKSQKYNCLVMVLTPCHVKEINVKSGPNSGSKVPLATIVVTDQSEIKKRVVLWRSAAFWALTVFPGDIILLTDVTVHEDQWVGETVLQSTFTSQLFNLGSYSCVRPEKYSSAVANVQDLLAYVSLKHSYLKDLPQRQPQKMNAVEFVELEQLQPDTLVHAVLRVVDVTVLTEALYSYRGQKQRKILLTVEQTQGQHYVLVLWGPGAAWYTQLQRKKGVVLIKAKVSELVFSTAAAQKIALNAHSSLKGIFSSLPNITYAGCAQCGSELEPDENRIYRQCLSCLPFAGKKTFYRPALMTIADGRHKTCVHVGSKMMERILLNISPDCLNRAIVPSSEVTYGTVAADLLHSLLAVSAELCVLKIQSLFELDENSYPLQQNFSLLDFCPDSCKRWSPGLCLRPEENTEGIPRKE